MLYKLRTEFSDAEKEILYSHIDKFNYTVSFFISVNSEHLSGVDEPNRMIGVGGLYLLEEKGCPNEWYMGELKNSTYGFWGNYGDLKSAIEGL
jgi:hypothetical protein